MVLNQLMPTTGPRPLGFAEIDGWLVPLLRRTQGPKVGQIRAFTFHLIILYRMVAH